MSDPQKPTIVIKRVKKVAGGHHGGAWKIAYADFVTAMMAFFLLMWLLGSVSKADREGIAEYFQTPLKVALSGGDSVGDRKSLIKGGGKDLTAKDGQVNKGGEQKATDLKAAKAELEKREAAKLDELKKNIEKLIDQNPMLRQFKRQLLIDITTEGLRIQIVDEQNRPMFNLASAELQPYTKVILREIGHALNDVEHRISLSGHTDSAPYAGGARGYGNWELSSERANASRRELIAGGMDADKMLRVVGLADAVPFDTRDKLAPSNRRISIIVLNRRAEEAIAQQAGGGNEKRVESAAAARAAVQPGTAPPSGVPDQP